MALNNSLTINTWPWKGSLLHHRITIIINKLIDSLVQNHVKKAVANEATAINTTKKNKLPN